MFGWQISNQIRVCLGFDPINSTAHMQSLCKHAASTLESDRENSTQFNLRWKQEFNGVKSYAIMLTMPRFETTVNRVIYTEIVRHEVSELPTWGSPESRTPVPRPPHPLRSAEHTTLSVFLPASVLTGKWSSLHEKAVSRWTKCHAQRVWTNPASNFLYHD